jgi:hypothetical protein
MADVKKSEKLGNLCRSNQSGGDFEKVAMASSLHPFEVSYELAISATVLSGFNRFDAQTLKEEHAPINCSPNLGAKRQTLRNREDR